MRRFLLLDGFHIEQCWHVLDNRARVFRGISSKIVHQSTAMSNIQESWTINIINQVWMESLNNRGHVGDIALNSSAQVSGPKEVRI